MSGLRSSLSRLVGQQPADADQLVDMARALWRQNSDFIVLPRSRMGWADQAAAEAIGEKIFGKRRG